MMCILYSLIHTHTQNMADNVLVHCPKRLLRTAMCVSCQQHYMATGRAQLVQGLGTGWKVRRSNPLRCENCRNVKPGSDNHPACWTMDTGFFVWVKRPECSNHPRPSNAELRMSWILLLSVPAQHVIWCTERPLLSLPNPN